MNNIETCAENVVKKFSHIPKIKIITILIENYTNKFEINTGSYNTNEKLFEKILLFVLGFVIFEKAKMKVELKYITAKQNNPEGYFIVNYKSTFKNGVYVKILQNGDLLKYRSIKVIGNLWKSNWKYTESGIQSVKKVTFLPPQAETSPKFYKGINLQMFPDTLKFKLNKPGKVYNTLRNYFPKTQGVNRGNLEMVKESIFSVSKPWDSKKLSDFISQTLGIGSKKHATITDATANVGGNTISFTNHFKYVNAFEINPQACSALKNNLSVYHVQKNVNVVCGDYTKKWNTVDQNAIFFDPPWGGPEYYKKDKIDLFLGNQNIQNIISDIVLSGKCNIFFIKIPHNFDDKKFKNDLVDSDIQIKDFEKKEFGKNHFVIFVELNLVPKKKSKTKVVNVKVGHIRPEYQNLKEWVNDTDKNVYIARKGIVFVPKDNNPDEKERFPKKDSIFHNPFKVKDYPNVEDVLEKYEEHLRNQLETGEITDADLQKLVGKNLGCWCKPKKCHGDIIMKILKEKKFI